jgi:hypothetical protein
MKKPIIGGIVGIFSGLLAVKLGYGMESLLGLTIVLFPVITFNVGYLFGRFEK